MVLGAAFSTLVLEFMFFGTRGLGVRFDSHFSGNKAHSGAWCLFDSDGFRVSPAGNTSSRARSQGTIVRERASGWTGCWETPEVFAVFFRAPGENPNDKAEVD